MGFIETKSMKRLVIKGKNNTSQIDIEAPIEWIKKELPKTSIFIITDLQVQKYYGQLFAEYPQICIGQGEAIKTVETVNEITQKLLSFGANRNSYLLGLGGGIVTDITGFVASIFMRGIDFGLIPTTLLAQIDASVGGKTGINFNAFKNILGSFHQPKNVFCNSLFLKTLSQDEFKSGMAELIKYGLISDSKMIKTIINSRDKILKLDSDVLSDLIEQSILIKSAIVEEDEFEFGRRKILNFGHTLGHAIEKNESIPHGKAVAIGMFFAAKLSLKKALISEIEFLEIQKVLEMHQLPLQFETSTELIIDAIKKDKKRGDSSIEFILLETIGKAKIETFTFEQLEQYIEALR